MIIYIDIDDTIEDLLVAWVKYLNRMYGTQVNYDENLVWDMETNFPTLTSEELYEPLYNLNFWDTVPIKLGAPGFIKKLKDEGNTIYLVTASRPSSLELKLERCIFKYFPFLDYDDVIMINDKSLLRGDILIDDGPHNLEGFQGLKILMDCAHNRSFDNFSHDFVRCYDWLDIYNTIKEYENVIREMNDGEGNA